MLWQSITMRMFYSRAKIRLLGVIQLKHALYKHQIKGKVNSVESHNLSLVTLI